ncbi:hypothetical protein EVA_13016, partial [gut metagenome]
DIYLYRCRDTSGGSNTDRDRYL